jgi:hypothetical protein
MLLTYQDKNEVLSLIQHKHGDFGVPVLWNHSPVETVDRYGDVRYTRTTSTINAIIKPYAVTREARRDKNSVIFNMDSTDTDSDMIFWALISVGDFTIHDTITFQGIEYMIKMFTKTDYEWLFVLTEKR